MKNKEVREPLLMRDQGEGLDDARACESGGTNSRYMEGGYLDLPPAAEDSDDGGAIRSQAGASSAADAIVGLKQLEAHRKLFQGLVKRVKVCTGKLDEEGNREPELNIINIVITYDSKHCIALTADERQEITQIQVYSLTTFDAVFHFEITGTWVVMNDVEQNLAGDTLCVPYSDNGKLRLIIFNNKGKKLAKLRMNDVFGIDE